jgi:hypothetical protein
MVQRNSAMAILSKLLSRIPPPKGIRLDIAHPFWEVSGETDFPSLLTALPDLLPEECLFYFEGGSPSGDLLEFLRAHGVAERAHVAYGTMWPKPTVFHLPVTPDAISRLAELTRSCAYPELAIHFHVYRDQSVLLEWHDAFTQPMLLCGEFLEQKVGIFAGRLRMSYRKCAELGAPPNSGPVAPPGGSRVRGGPPSVS